MSRAIVLAMLASSWITACSGNDFEAAENGAGAGGTSDAAGGGGKGSSSGGAASGGTASGGAATGGTSGSSGGAATGGAATGGTSGGAASGGADGGSAGSMSGGGSDAGGMSSGGAPGCGALGSACVNDCPQGLDCNNGLCVPVGRPSCGGFNPVECPNTHPNCLYCAGCDFGDCFTAAELACVCAAPNVDMVYDGCS